MLPERFANLQQLDREMATKIAVFDFTVFQVTAPAAVVVFAVTFLITDIVNEKFGQIEVHKMIFITFATQVAMVVFLAFGTTLPPAPFWDKQHAWEDLLGVVPRITFASWITFLVSENFDAWLYAKVRAVTHGQYLWMRNVFSTIPALTVDTVVFVTLAFYGTDLPLSSLMVGQFAAKYVVGIANVPFMYLNRAILGEIVSPYDKSGTTSTRHVK